jgi:hypothetical protein
MVWMFLPRRGSGWSRPAQLAGPFGQSGD